MEVDPLYRKIELECTKCKTKFQIWIEEKHLNAEFEERLKKNFYKYCPVCKTFEEINKEVTEQINK